MQNNLIRELLKIKLDSDFLFQFLTDPAKFEGSLAQLFL